MYIKNFILDELQKEYTLDNEIDIDNFNYIDNGIIDSLGLIQFIIRIEDEFNIQFSDDEISGEDFKIVGKLINLIEGKVEKNEKF